MRLLKDTRFIGAADTAMTSVATFGYSGVAAVILPTAELGIFAYTLSALWLAVAIATNLAYRTYEVAGVRDRTFTGYYSPGLSGLALSVFFGLISGFMIQVVVGPFVAFALLPAAVTVAVLHEHARRVAHIDQVGQKAIMLSGWRLVVSGLGLLAIVSFELLNVTSLVALMVLAYMSPWTIRLIFKDGRRFEWPSASHWRLGMSLLVMTGLPALTTFIVVHWVLTANSAEAVGVAEAARIVMQPVLLLATGIILSLGPELIRRSSTQGTSRDLFRSFFAIFLSGTVLFLIVLMFFRNLIDQLVPAALSSPTVVIWTVVAAVFGGAAMPVSNWFLGRRREGSLALAELGANIFRLSAGFIAAGAGAVAIPLSGAALTVSRIGLLGISNLGNGSD